jgi:hypothetical protein
MLFIFRAYISVMCFKKILCGFQDSEVLVPCIHSDDVVFRSDDENFLFELQSVSKSFELFQVASVRTSQQHLWMPFSTRQVKGLSFQTLIWEDNCKPSGRRSYSVQTLSFIRQDMQKSCNRPNVSLHYPNAQSLLWKLHAAEVQPSRH